MELYRELQLLQHRNVLKVVVTVKLAALSSPDTSPQMRSRRLSDQIAPAISCVDRLRHLLSWDCGSHLNGAAHRGEDHQELQELATALYV